jgi:hypothetical protein
MLSRVYINNFIGRVKNGGAKRKTQTIRYFKFTLLLFNITLTKKIQHPQAFGKTYVKISGSIHSTTEHLENVFRKLQQQTNQGRI